MKVTLISTTHPVNGTSAEDLMVYTARVSSPQNQNDLDTGSRLLRYCIKHGHWSVFEMADMTVEIQTSRAISAQILRHRSFSFQEFSQRYARVDGFEVYEARKQDPKNRQNSTDDLTLVVKEQFVASQQAIIELSARLYDEALGMGIAKECARFLLPLSTSTKLYMKGSVRSWIHYLKARAAPATQLEHREIALEIAKVFSAAFPVCAEAAELAP